ncbi:MAG TPA: 6-phosphogluconolactonase [Acidobacteriota bacterium]|nr:6-phosphogluconolactonase [Acidobacteriota bacterium]
MSNREIRILADPSEVALAGAAEVLAAAQKAVSDHGYFALALSGGSTPKVLYGLLADDASFREKMPWSKTHFFWGDERHVPPDHPDSNFRMTQQAMLSKITVPQENVHRIHGENPDAAAAAQEYETDLRRFFKLSSGAFPRLDLVLLGMGPDGHTASLFPGTPALKENKLIVTANPVAKFNTDRITMTYPTLNNASRIVFLVNGTDKAQPLREVLQGKSQPDLYPSQNIAPTNGTLLWLIDRSAGSLLDQK